jgi:glutathione peroxidase
MMRFFTAAAVGTALVGALFLSSFAADQAPAKTPDALNFTMKDIDGKEVNLATYSGKVVMILNVASKCGNTPQYTALEQTFEKYKDKGFVILGFPANNFGGQEPGTNEQIKAFCTETNYDVKFPLFAKTSVKGDDINPLFKYLITVDTKPQPKGAITWNFEKFLIGKDGKVAARFAPKTKPDDPAVVAAIESALAK